MSVREVMVKLGILDRLQDAIERCDGNCLMIKKSLIRERDGVRADMKSSLGKGFKVFYDGYSWAVVRV